MKVKLLQRAAGPLGTHLPGAVIDVPAAVGKHLIDTKQAAAVDASTAKRTGSQIQTATKEPSQTSSAPPIPTSNEPQT